MALVSVTNSNDKFLASASNADFKNSIDADRYKQFVSAPASIAGGSDMLGISEAESTKLFELINSTLSKVKTSQFGSISSSNEKAIIDMIADNATSMLDVGGDVFSRSELKNKMSSICGHFDSGIYGKYSGDDMLTGFSLSALLAALLCMAVNGAIAIISAAVTALDLAITTVLDIVTNTLDTLVFNPAKDIYNGIAKNVFSPTSKALAESGLDTNGMLSDITSNPLLVDGFKDTNTAKRLLSGVLTQSNFGLGNTTDTSKYEEYADLLLTDWRVSDLASTSNASSNILLNSRSTIITDVADVFNISDVDKKDFMKLL